MRRITRLLASVGISALLVTALGAPSSAGAGTTRWVDDDGRAGPARGCNGTQKAYESIQDAIDQSNQGDTIIVCPGTYSELLRIEGDLHGLTIRGAVPWKARLRAPIGIPERDNLVQVDGVRRVTLQHLLLVFPTGARCIEYEDAINAREAHGIRIMGNRIRWTGPSPDRPCGYRGGIRIENSRNVRVSSNLIKDAKSDGIAGQGTVGVIHGNSVRLVHRVGHSSTGIGFGDSKLTISANVVRTRRAYRPDRPYFSDGIVMFSPRAGSIIRNNRVSGGFSGIDFRGSDGRILRNRATGNGYGLFLSSDGGGNRIRNNDARGNSGLDCVDESTGSGTAGTANTWVNNLGNAQDPDGICGGRR